MIFILDPETIWLKKWGKCKKDTFTESYKDTLEDCKENTKAFISDEVTLEMTMKKLWK